MALFADDPLDSFQSLRGGQFHSTLGDSNLGRTSLSGIAALDANPFGQSNHSFDHAAKPFASARLGDRSSHLFEASPLPRGGIDEDAMTDLSPASPYQSPVKFSEKWDDVHLGSFLPDMQQVPTSFEGFTAKFTKPTVSALSVPSELMSTAAPGDLAVPLRSVGGSHILQPLPASRVEVLWPVGAATEVNPAYGDLRPRPLQGVGGSQLPPTASAASAGLVEPPTFAGLALGGSAPLAVGRAVPLAQVGGGRGAELALGSAASRCSAQNAVECRWGQEESGSWFGIGRPAVRVEPYWEGGQWWTAAPVDFRGLEKRAGAGWDPLDGVDYLVQQAKDQGAFPEMPPPPKWQQADSCPIS